MIRTLLWLTGGLGLGVLVHLVVILSLPLLAEETLWTKVRQMDNFEKLVVLDDLRPSSDNPFKLDPELIYGICRLDLGNGVGLVNARMPDAFWSISVFDSTGRAIYGTTNRSGVGQVLQLGVFNEEQILQLSRQQLDVADGLLIVEAERNDIFIVVRLAPAHPAMRARYRNLLSQVSCGRI